MAIALPHAAATGSRCLVVIAVAVFILGWAGGCGLARGADYDPLSVGLGKPDQKELVVKDERRARDLPIRVYLPAAKTPAAVILFSHGLGGSRTGNEYLGDHWAARGYVAVFLQHPGSDDALWKDQALEQRAGALQGAVGAAGLENFLLRVQDVHAVLDQLERWNMAAGHVLAGRLDLKRVGMSGHSFGAVTTQAVSGQTFPMGKGFTDSRIKAAVLMSPSPPRRGDPAQAFGAVRIPWMVLTGTKDNSPKWLGLDTDAAARQRVFPALPAGGKYELVLDGAEHSAFGDRELPGETGRHNPNHHRAILAVTTAFWDACLRDDAAAKQWLDGATVRGVLEKDDQWQKK